MTHRGALLQASSSYPVNRERGLYLRGKIVAPPPGCQASAAACNADVINAKMRVDVRAFVTAREVVGKK